MAGGIGAPNTGKRAATDICLRPLDNWDRRYDDEDDDNNNNNNNTLHCTGHMIRKLLR